MEEKTLLNTREVARFLDVNEKMVYSLIADKGLPATKATGKWLFPRALVEQWLENQTVNYPKTATTLPPYHGLLIIAGSNDILLDKALSLFNRLYLIIWLPLEIWGVWEGSGHSGGISAIWHRVTSCRKTNRNTTSDLPGRNWARRPGSSTSANGSRGFSWPKAIPGRSRA